LIIDLLVFLTFWRSFIMQIIKFSSVAVTILAAGAFSLLVPQLSTAADMNQPGKGWDTFQSGSGQRLPDYSQAYMGTSMNSAPGQGWDVFHSGAEGAVPVTTSYKGTSMSPSTGQGWDVFHSGVGDRI
jgi:hypothetical protein